MIARQLGNQSQSLVNATPIATASTSPASALSSFTNIVSSATVVAGAGNRSGIVFHNPGNVENVYVYPTNITPTPTSAVLGGSFVIYPGSTLSFPSPLFANVNGTWAAFSGSGGNAPFTVVEFL